MSSDVIVVDPLSIAVGLEESIANAVAFLQRLLATEPNGEKKCIGFDMEWTTTTVPTSKDRITSKVAVVQVSSSAVTLVCRVSLLPLVPCKESAAHLEELLRSVLKSSILVKVGAGIFGDKAKLEHDYAWHVAACVDLNRMEELIDASVIEKHAAEVGVQLLETHKKGLKALALRWTGVSLAKEVSIATSDWASPTSALTDSQIRYAADDALYSVRVAEAMLQRVDSEQGNSPLQGEFLVHCIDKVPKPSGGLKSHSVRVQDGKFTDAPRPETLAKAEAVYDTRKKAYYDNIQCYDPSDVLLFTVDKKKADWYVGKKQLADVIQWRLEDGTVVANCDGSPSPPNAEMSAIRLRFTPDFGRYNDQHIRRDLEYYKTPKENRCVVCGLYDKVIRFAVVPLMYRKHFPVAYISHNSYDLLLVCPTCFAKITFYHDIERDKLAAEFNFPLATNSKVNKCSGGGEETPTVFEQVQMHRQIVHNVIKYAAALYRNKMSSALVDGSDESKATRRKATHAAWMPQDRVAELEAYVKEHYFEYQFTECDPREGANAGDCPTNVNPLSEECLSKLMRSDVHEVVSRRVDITVGGGDSDHAVDTVGGKLPTDTHAAYVVAMMAKRYPDEGIDAGIGEFIFRWRMLFLAKLQPQFLPKGWVAEEGILLPKAVTSESV